MAPVDDVVTKGEFAKLCGVSPGRITQWIDEGKITGDALVGEGRSAKIRVEVAKRQVALRRDIGQAFGNGLDTRLANPIARILEDDDDPIDPTSTDDVDRKIKLAKLEAVERANRLSAIEEDEKNGVYTETATVRAEMGKIAVQIMRIFEGALPELATAIAGEFKLQARDVTHFLNERFTKIREQAAKAAAAAAKEIPETIET